MSFRLNDDVKTPIGNGVVQGRRAEDGRILVRIQITDENRRHLADVNCDTPRATLSGVWLFEESSLLPVQQGRAVAARRRPVPDPVVTDGRRGK